MKRARRWQAREVRRLQVVSDQPVVVQTEERPLACGLGTRVETSYPPSANNSKFRSGRLKERTMEYRRSIAWLYRAAGGKEIAGSVALEIELYPPAHRGAVPHDVDNSLQNILNGLKGVAYEDDSQVVLLTVAKLWPKGEGRAVVTVKKIAPATKAGA